jgi:hypothetical protein
MDKTTTEHYKRLVQPKFMDFFSNKDSEYMASDGVSQAYYIGIAEEFVNIMYSRDLKRDYEDLYSVFKNRDNWLFVDTLAALSDEFISSLTAIQVVTLFGEMAHKELFCDGFIELCGKTGTIIRLLNQLKAKLERSEQITEGEHNEQLQRKNKKY